MTQKPARTRMLSALIVAVLFIAAQLLFRFSGSMGGVCIDSLTNPSHEPIPWLSWVDYGFPLFFFRVSREGCGSITYTDFFLFALLINVAVFSLIGLVLNYLLSRFRTQDQGSGEDSANHSSDPTQQR